MPALVAVIMLGAGISACSIDARHAPSRPAPSTEPGPFGTNEPPDVTVGPPSPRSQETSALAFRPVTGSGWFGVKGSLGQPATRPYVATLPSSWTFAEVEWCDVEPTAGRRSWKRLNLLIDDAHRLGHRIMLKLRTGTCWGTTPPSSTSGLSASRPGAENVGKEPSTPPIDLDAYLRHVAAVVDHARDRGVHTFAVENETDVVSSWASTIAEYDALVRAVVPVVRAQDPAAHVLESGLSSTSYGVVLASRRLARGNAAGALATYRTHYARRQDGGASRWPTVANRAQLRSVLASPAARRSVASFRLARRLVVDDVVDGYQLHAYESAPALRQVLRLLGRTLPRRSTVEAWEVGVAWPGRPGPLSVAESALRSAALLVAAGVRRLVFLPVAWTPNPRPQVFRGLAGQDGSVRPVGRTWAALARAFDGAAPRSVTRVGAVLRPRRTTRLVGVRWRSDDRTWAILWSPRGGSAPPWPLDRVITAAGVRGSDSRIGRSPVLVRRSRR